MGTRDEETEVKFYLREFAGVPDRILGAGGRLLAPRTHEYNLRFDTADHSLENAGRLLRLRQERTCYLTYKDQTHVESGALRRREIELQVGDFDTCLRLVEALGYRIVFIYEKYRTTYVCGNCKVMLDELPMGDFVEIEGDRTEIEDLAGRLGLKWQCAIPRSYHALFDGLRRAGMTTLRDLTFENFAGRTIDAEALGVSPADA
jgi:adenylate cyclase class 2